MRGLGGEPVVPSRHGQARGQPLDIPLERPGQGLVEVVDVEDQAPLGRGERAEIGEVRIAAQLGAHAWGRSAGEIRCHHRRRAPVEREWRLQHPAMADGNGVWHPRLRLAQQQPDRIPLPARLELGLRLPRGAAVRASLPRATRFARLSCSIVLARVEPLPDVRAAGLPVATPSVFTVMATPSVCWELPGWPMGLRSTPRAPFHLVAGRVPSP